MICVVLKSEDQIVCRDYEIDNAMIWFPKLSKRNAHRTLSYCLERGEWFRSSVMAVALHAVYQIESIDADWEGNCIDAADAAWLEGRDNG